MAQNINQPVGTITTGPFRLSYPSLAEPSSYNDGEPKYSVQLFFPKENKELTRQLAAAVQGVVQQTVNAAGNKQKFTQAQVANKSVTMPIQDGDRWYSEDPKDGREFAKGNFVFRVKSNRQPLLLDMANQVVPQENIEDVFYPGCLCHAKLSFFAYKHPSGGKGISCSISALRKVAEGERLDGRVNATAEEFKDLPIDIGSKEDDDDPFGVNEEPKAKPAKAGKKAKAPEVPPAAEEDDIMDALGLGGEDDDLPELD